MVRSEELKLKLPSDQPFRIRTEEFPQLTGFLNLTIMEMSLVKLYRQRMLLCSEWYAGRSLGSKLEILLTFWQLRSTYLFNDRHQHLWKLFQVCKHALESQGCRSPSRRNGFNCTRQASLESTSLGAFLR